MKRAVLIPILFFLLIGSCFAQDEAFDESTLSETGRQAYRQLLQSELFALGGIGYTGKISEGEKAFDVLIEDKQALPAFKSLVKNASVEGALYGLLGLKMLDCDCFQNASIAFVESRTRKDNNETLAFQTGCAYVPLDDNESKKNLIENLLLKEFAAWTDRKKKLVENRKARQTQLNPNIQ